MQNSSNKIKIDGQKKTTEKTNKIVIPTTLKYILVDRLKYNGGREAGTNEWETGGGLMDGRTNTWEKQTPIFP